MFRKEVDVLMMLFYWLVAAGVQCRTRPDELPAPAERRSGATNHYSLPERDNLEPRALPAPVPERCPLPCVERGDAGAGRVSRLLLGQCALQTSLKLMSAGSNRAISFKTATASCAKKITKVSQKKHT